MRKFNGVKWTVKYQNEGESGIYEEMIIRFAVYCISMIAVFCIFRVSGFFFLGYLSKILTRKVNLKRAFS